MMFNPRSEQQEEKTICNKATISKTKCQIRKKKQPDTWHCKYTHYTIYSVMCFVQNKIFHIECVKRSVDISSKNKIANESFFFLSVCFDMVYVFFPLLYWLSFTTKKAFAYTLYAHKLCCIFSSFLHLFTILQ